MQNTFLWHSLTTEQVLERLASHSEKGLSQEEVQKRQKKDGPNELPREKPLSKLKLLLHQFQSPLIYILVIAAGVVFLFDKQADFIVISAAIILNVSMGFFQEYKASRALHELKQIIKIKAQIIREGKFQQVEARELVSGDIFFITAGNRIPADARLLEAHNLEINEASLTGEWLAQEKKVEELPPETPLFDRHNLIFMGTTAEEGRGRAIVIATGPNTEIGKIGQEIKEIQEEVTPLQKKLARFSKKVGLIILVISGLILGGGLLQKQPWLEMAATAIAVAVAAIPEGLPITLTVILALGMQRILTRKGLVRKLVAAETLGSTSIICADKTLTLTQGKMEVAAIFAFSGEKREVLEAAALANEAQIENIEESSVFWKIRGRATDRALILAAAQAGIKKPDLDQKFPELKQFPFKPENKFVGSLRKVDQKNILYLAGAPEKIIELSVLDRSSLERINSTLENLTRKGQRVIAVAFREIESPLTNLQNLIGDLNFVGLIGLRDPLRPKVIEVIRAARQAGIKTIVVSGDHLLTTQAIAQELGLKTEEENILEGSQLDKLSEEKFQKQVEEIQVYARVEPRHKLRIVRAWQNRGQVVAMTGDGINDAPALKKADIGVVLSSGTDIAREVADLVLLDDDFETILAAVEQGRGMLENIRKVITYLLSDSFSETILVGGSILLGLPLPITAAQILWVNLIEDGLPAMALAFEPSEKEIMHKPPTPVDAPLLTDPMKAIIFIIGIVTDLVLFALFFWFWRNHHSLEYIRTMIFAGLSLNSLFYVFSCRSLRKNLWQINLFSNRLLVLAVVLGLISILSALYFPLLQELLNTIPLAFADWLILISLGIMEIILIEATKYYFIVSEFQ